MSLTENSSPIAWEMGPLVFSDRITVEAVVELDHAAPEAMQSLVSQWEVRDDFSGFEAHDAGAVATPEGSGFFGAVFDGRHVYFCPMQYDRTAFHGRVLRYDTQADFQRDGSYEVYDASLTDGLDARGFYGGAFDGRYVYFVPRKTENERHSRVLRFDTAGDFHSPVSWSAHDPGLTNCRQGAAFDGRYLYFVPGYDDENPGRETAPSNTVLRFDTQGGFRDESSWKTYDAGSGARPSGCFDGAVFDGRFVYFVPLLNEVVLRYDTHAPFDASSSWQRFDGAGLKLGSNVGAVFDGIAVYFVPYGHSHAVRYDCLREFSDAASWSHVDLSAIFPQRDLGFDGGFYDGRYVYYVPFIADTGNSPSFHANFVRYDRTMTFDDPAAWRLFDAASTNGLATRGYNAGAFDGRYFYCAPWRAGSGAGEADLGVHARILRYDTTGDRAVFSLRLNDFGHNGGLCASVPGPTFLVNTDRGVIGISSHSVLAPGRHHLAGVYDGRFLRLYLNGHLVAERSASGQIVSADVPLQIGNRPSEAGRTSARIVSVRVTAEAASADALAGRARQADCRMIKPTAFSRSGRLDGSPPFNKIKK